MPITTWIRDFLGLWKDRKELTKLTLETEKLQEEKREREFITRASFDDVKDYDQKYEQIRRNIRIRCSTCGGSGRLGSGALCYGCGGAGAIQEKGSSGKAGTGGCFIATATYGSPTAPEVLFLREFRDNVLLPSTFGTWFVKTYYVISPHVAGVIALSPRLRFIIRRFLLHPLVRLLKSK